MDLNKVSVIIPCFNDGRYLRESLQSVKNQTYDNIEIIICNDGSTDELTLQVLDECSNAGIMVLHLTNRGPAVARNKGIKIATGKYILPLDADDCIEKSYIEKAVKTIEKDCSIGAVYCYADLFGNVSGRWNLPDYSLERMLVDNIVFVTAVFRKEDWEKVGGFCENFKYGMEDYDFWLSILSLGKKIVQLPEVLFFYRIKDISRTTKFNGSIENIIETYDLLYRRHKKFYYENMDLYCQSLRHELIGRDRYARKLEKAIGFMAILDRFPIIKIVLKGIVYRMFF